MQPGERVEQLLEEILISRRTPEDVCVDAPEMLPEVRRRLEHLRNVELELQVLFPRSEEVPCSYDHAGSPGESGATIAQSPLIPGYEIEQVLGRGGMGIVYKGKHLKLGRTVAIKMLLTTRFVSSHETASLVREAKSIAAMKHPNIVQVHDVGDVEGCPYFTMEFMEGGTLAQKLVTAPVTTITAAEIIVTLCGAVDAAHRCGIIHRDLKPANVLLTLDGIPKIADFGLAVSLGDGTRSIMPEAARIGTPSYMAPEQALGKAKLGPATDVYALGAILYELLTGLPPFRGETPVETERRLLCDDPVPPTLLQSSVPRDLETICLKCLNKLSALRYPSAATLADDLRRLLRFEPILARCAGCVERSLKWARRHPTLAVGATGIALLAILATAGILGHTTRRALLRSSVADDLTKVARREAAGQWDDAAAILRQAKARLELESSEDLRQRVDAASLSLDVARRLDAIRLSRVTAGSLAYYQKRADDAYEREFLDSLSINVGSPAEQVTRVIATSPIRGTLVAALDDWATCARSPDRRRWLLEMARGSDADSNPWNDRIRDPANWDDPKALDELVHSVPVNGSSLSALLGVGQRLALARRDSASFLRRVQQQHPEDFWANLLLGDVLLARSPGEAGLYYRAALAARPAAAVGYGAVGDSLRMQHKYPEAIAYYRKALTFDPAYARAECSLGSALNELGQRRQAVDACEASLRIDPNYAWAHLDLANAFRGLGRYDEAIRHYEAVGELNPDAPSIQEGYWQTLVQAGRGEDARQLWSQAIQKTPDDFKLWSGYPDLCLFLGNEPESERAIARMLETFASRNEPSIAEPLALSCLALPAADLRPGDLEKACVLANRVFAARVCAQSVPNLNYQFGKALAEYRQGHLGAAITLLRGDAAKAMGPCPKLVLAMALRDTGDDAGAVRTLAEISVRQDWRPAKADRRDLWIYHVLRRQAEARVLPVLPLLLNGSRAPANNDERVIMIGACQFQGRHSLCVQLFTDALGAEPDLLERRDLHPGFVAACTASLLAASGDRRQAAAWLNDELASQLRRNGSRNAQSRAWLHKELLAWTWDPSLAPLQDDPAFAALWKSVGDAIVRLGEDAGTATSTRPATQPAKR